MIYLQRTVGRSALQFLGRVRELLDIETAAAVYFRYLWGVLKGLVSPITGLVELAIAGVRFQAAAIEWITGQVMRAPELIAEAQGLSQDFQRFQTAAEQTLTSLRQRERLLEFAGAIFAAASSAGEALQRQLVSMVYCPPCSGTNWPNK